MDSNSNSDKVFADYASAYDILYSDKDYAGESQYICKLIEKVGISVQGIDVLDLGCGTGNYAHPLLKCGNRVWGVDLSDQMLRSAEAKLRSEFGEKVNFLQGDIATVDVGRQFKVVVCMFAVIGYQTSNQALLQTFKNVRRHLEPGGVFLFDFWYGPAVLSERPTDRIKSVSADNRRVIRTTKTELDTNSSVATVNFGILDIIGNNVAKEYKEVHRMRYFFEPELDLIINQVGFKSVEFYPFGKFDQGPSCSDWNVIALVRG